MCGITGFWLINKQYSFSFEQVIKKMAKQLHTRGPDNSGIWFDEMQGIAFGHTRLSIIDCSKKGAQPMVSSSGRFVISYNGEIYNAKDIKKELAFSDFKGGSDTEVMLEAIEEWGLDKALSHFIGMFAFSLFDRKLKKLYLVRDRLGIKPIYWGILSKTLFFGSQLKSFIPHPNWDPTLCRRALSTFFEHNYIPAPLSIYENVYKIRPGHYVSIDEDIKINDVCYWNILDVYKEGKKESKTYKEIELIKGFASILNDSIKKRLISDVPIGAFLSGGVDSSLVAALMQEHSSKPIKTFSIGFHEEDYNEANFAKSVAQYLGTDHNELYVTSKDALDVIPTIPEWCDEPFADSSQIPAYILSKFARNSVAVSLSGDGGDELFAGYNRYLITRKLKRLFSIIPKIGRKLSVKLLNVLNPQFLASFFCYPQLPDKIEKLSRILSLENLEKIYHEIIAIWPPHEINHTIGTHNPFIDNLWAKLPNVSYIEKMQLADLSMYLPCDILTKVDRASMAHGLETRVPLLDHRVVSFACKIPLHLKINQSSTKWILREILYSYVPKKLIERPKMGFGVPIAKWLRGPLKEWAIDLLSEETLDRNIFTNKDIIAKKLKEHLSGEKDWGYHLWTVLMFQAWFQRYHR
ncbi:MAG: asparagine synthase (glutamine-hydrolyzing) [Alphaproteobacteria bacterium]